MATKILVVDDSPTVLHSIKRILEAAGYEIITADTGTEGQQMAREEGPDLVVLDLELPDISGFEVCRRVRSDPDRARAAVPVLMLTNMAEGDNLIEAQGAGADVYLPKSEATPERLAGEVERLLHAPLEPRT